MGGEKYIYHDVLCENLISKGKVLQTKIKNYNLRTSVFHLITVLVLKGLLNSAFVISPQKRTHTSQFYSSELVEDGRDQLISLECHV